MKAIRKLRIGGFVAGFSMVLAMLAVTAPAAQAEAPANDSWENATYISSMPYRTRVNLAEATTDSVNPPGRDRAHSVWWRVTVKRDRAIYMSTQRDNRDVNLSLFHANSQTASPRTWTPIARSHENFVRWLEAGEVYFVEISTDNGYDGDGDVALVVRRSATVLYSLSNTGKYDRVDGSAIIRGTIKSTVPTTVSMSASLSQRVGNHVVRGWGYADLNVKRTLSTWTLRVESDRPFKVGSARVASSSLVFYDHGARVPGIFRFVKPVVTLE
jgi:hypothetical protein